MAHLIELKDLIEAGLHFGHQTKRWNPKMKSYIFDKRNGIHIIDLTQTVELIDEAAEFLRGVVAKGQKILFVATKKQAQEVVKEAALTCNQFYMTERWLGGTLTNNQTIRRSVKRMQQIQNIARQNNGVLSEHKQEASALARELAKLETNLTGIAEMDKMPGALFVVDVCREANAVKEAKRLGIPVVAIVDTNADPDPIDYVIPGNDDSVRGIELIVTKLADILKDADIEAAKAAAEAQAQAEQERAQKAAADRAARKETQGARKLATGLSGRRAPAANTRRAAAAAAQEAVAAAAQEAVAAKEAEAAPAEAPAETPAAE
ncbi:MAG TPA: 30S ribosomal protein S2 [Candidatus Spyradenecus faecavium]|uniref:Small ribosomal subunit protein uS2 n=1 Tax=Candidatus Spyradenecus faecavium TaxID=2840947 RepID=A0A9D1NMJ1_9BACT|nr:30S ribosomal protein S2 [Candidatus Spyradenecus faecavium]